MTPAPDAPPPARRSVLHVVVGLATVLMSALAAGAVWSLAALWTGRSLSPLALAVGALVGIVLRTQHLAGRWWSSVVGVGATLLAGSYAGYLIASADVAVLLGLPIRATLPRIGPDMALALAWARATPWDLGLLGIGALTAALLALRAPETQGQ